jgi:hypothetical protein
MSEGGGHSWQIALTLLVLGINMLVCFGRFVGGRDLTFDLNSVADVLGAFVLAELWAGLTGTSLGR